MQELYFVSASVSASASLTLVKENSIVVPYYNVDNLIVCSSLYEIIAFSGSTQIAIFPQQSTNLYYYTYTPFPLIPTQSFSNASSISIPSFYNFIISPYTTSSNSSGLSIYNSYTSQSYVNQTGSNSQGSFDLILGNKYIITLSGSGQFYSASITINNLTTGLTEYSTSSFNTYLTASFSSSVYNQYYITASINNLPGMYLKYGAATIPVSPTSSLDAWNTYLNTSASLLVVTSSGGYPAFYILGGNLDTVDTINITGSKLSSFTSFGMTNLISCSINSDLLDTSPNIEATPNLRYLKFSPLVNGSTLDISTTPFISYFNCSGNRLSGSITPISSSYNLQIFDCNNNALTGSIPYLYNSYNLLYLDCSDNKLSNYSASWIPLTTASFATSTLLYFDASNNLLSQSAVDAILKDFYYQGALFNGTGSVSGTLNLGGTGNAAPSAFGSVFKSQLQLRGWTVTTN